MSSALARLRHSSQFFQRMLPSLAKASRHLPDRATEYSVLIEEHVQRYLVYGKPWLLRNETDLKSSYFFSERQLLEVSLPEDSDDLEDFGLVTDNTVPITIRGATQDDETTGDIVADLPKPACWPLLRWGRYQAARSPTPLPLVA